MKKHFSNAYYTVKEKQTLHNSVAMFDVFEEKSEIMAVKINPGDKLVACGYGDGFVRLFNTKSNTKGLQINTAQKEHSPVTALHWKPINPEEQTSSTVLLVANANGNIYQYETKTGKEIFHHKEEGNQIMAVDYNSSGTQFCTAGKDNSIKIYDEETKHIKNVLEGVMWQKVGHNNRIFCVKYKKDDRNLLASGGWDQNVHIWDLRSKEVAITLHGPQIVGDAIDLTDNSVLTGAHRGKDQLQLWDLRQGQVVHSFKWSEYQKETDGYIYCCQFSNNQTNLVFAVGSKDAKVYNLEDKSEIFGVNFFEEENILYSCDSAYNSCRFAVGGKKGCFYYFGTNKYLE